MSDDERLRNILVSGHRGDAKLVENLNQKELVALTKLARSYERGKRYLEEKLSHSSEGKLNHQNDVSTSERGKLNLLQLKNRLMISKP